MLVLTRKMGEEIVIGDNIKLIVSRIAGNRVTIGINAPGNVTILRGELDHVEESGTCPAFSSPCSRPYRDPRE